jgi:hypothetical protein
MARKAKHPGAEGPFEGPPGAPAYDPTGIPVVDVRLSPERRLSFRLPRSHARWQGDFADLGTLSEQVLGLIEPPVRLNFVVESETRHG